MTEENKKLLEELTQDRMEEVMRLEADNEEGKVVFNEVVSLLKHHTEVARIENETRSIEAKIEQDKLDAELKKAEFEASSKEAELKLAHEKRALLTDVMKWGIALVVTTLVVPAIKLRNNINLAQTFAALEKEDYYNGTPYKSLKGLFRFE